MEALGAASAVLDLGKAAWTISAALYKLYRDTQRVNKTVDDIAREVKALARTCDTIHDELKEVVGETAQNSSFKIAHLAPGLANQELSQKVGQLQDCIQRLQIQLQTAPQTQSLDSGATLLDYAKGVVLSGATLYEASVAGGSVVGGADAATSNTRVAAWLSSFESLRRDAHSSEPSDDMASRTLSVFSGDERRTGPTDATSANLDPPSHQDIGDADTDSDVDFTTEIIESALQDGARAFKQEEWLEAELLYEEALQNLHQLPVQFRPACDTFELQYRLAVCAYHTEEPNDVEHALTGLMQQPAISLPDEQTGYICDAGHMLSHLYVRVGKLDQAKVSCERTLKARTRLFGKLHASRLESLALMARIEQLLHNQTRARIFINMIPEDRRDDFRATVQALGISQPSSSTQTQSAVGSIHANADILMSTLALVDSEPDSAMETPSGGENTRSSALECSRTTSAGSGSYPHRHLP
ncbi:hypothetical protein LTR65_002280 [Meristemomyces frigidus]